MNYKQKYVIFDIDGSDLQRGSPVGYEVEFSPDSNFRNVTNSILTFQEIPSDLSNGKIEYSVDSGETWIPYPFDSYGVKFFYPYKIRITANQFDTSYVIAENNGIINKIGADNSKILSSYSLESEGVISDLEIDNNNNCFLVDDKRIMVINVDKDKIEGKTFPLLADKTLGISIDNARKTFWQVNSESIYLRDFYGKIILSIPVPEDIDVEISSSSSSSSIDSSSSSSEDDI